MSTTVFDHPILSGLLGDAEIAAHFSVAAELAAMLAFEVSLAKAEAEAGLIPQAAADAIAAARPFVALCRVSGRSRRPFQSRGRPGLASGWILRRVRAWKS